MPTPRPRMSSRSSDRLTAFCATPARSGVLHALAHPLDSLKWPPAALHNRRSHTTAAQLWQTCTRTLAFEFQESFE